MAVWAEGGVVFLAAASWLWTSVETERERIEMLRRRKRGEEEARRERDKRYLGSLQLQSEGTPLRAQGLESCLFLNQTLCQFVES